MAIVIDKKGKELKCEPVDAKELIASGEYTAPKADKPKKKAAPKADK